MSSTAGLSDYRTCEEHELVWEFNQGRPRIRTWPDGGQVPVHRLNAIAWFGWDAVEGKDVHHRIGPPWLNIESNLLPIPKPEHWDLTGRHRKQGPHERIVQDVINGLECNSDVEL